MCYSNPHLHVILILLNIYFYINAILDGIFKTKNSTQRGGVFYLLILQIDLYTICSYTSIEYMITSLLVSLLEADASSILGASVSVFSSVFTLSLLEEDSRSCLRCSSLFACASCSRFSKDSLILSVVSFQLVCALYSKIFNCFWISTTKFS